MRQQAGFTLIELMIVVVVLGIIAAVALPSYNEHLRTGRRAEAMRGVSELQLGLERWRAECTTYASNNSCPGTYPSTASVTSSFYDIGISGQTGTAYTITATRKGKQAGDPCGSLTATATSKPTWATASCNK